MERQQVQNLINEITTYVRSKEPINSHIDRIGDILDQIVDWVSPSMIEVISSNLKSKVQRDANVALDLAGGSGGCIMATGTGKSKIGVDRIDDMLFRSPSAKCLIVVPTEGLRDNGWKKEFEKWGHGELFEKITIICYASLKNIRDSEYHLVILDEGHNLTPHSAEFFFDNNNKVANIVLLTATRPEEYAKRQLLNRLGIRPVYSITLDEAVKLRLVAPYEITIIKVPLDETTKYIVAGNKEKRFKITEKQQYNYINRNIGTDEETDRDRRIRYSFFSKLKSKADAAQKLLEYLIPKNIRTLIFAASKEQANVLCEHRYYTKYSKKTVDLDDFTALKINRLACIEALNEGRNIPELDCCLKVKLDGKIRKVTQQLGRNVRFRANHKGQFIILCSENTVEEEWASKSLSGFDPSKVHWVTLNDIKTRKYTINFND